MNTLTLFNYFNQFTQMSNYLSIAGGNLRKLKALIILGSMSPDMVADIVAVVNDRGSSLATDLFVDTGGVKPLARPLAMFSREYIPDEAFKDTWGGFSIMCLSMFRAPKWGFDEWESTFQNAFALPKELASTMAKRIETEDILGGANQGVLSKIWNTTREGVRKFTNAITAVTGLPWEWDQDQSYDTDLLYEMAVAGRVSEELALRAHLMVSQTKIHSLGMLTTKGDPGSDAYGDVAAEVGEAAYQIGKPLLPKGVYGGLFNIAKLGKNIAGGKMRSATSSAKGNPALASILQGLLAAAPSLLALANVNKQGGGAEQDTDTAATGEVLRGVRDEYGDAIGDLLEAGDIEGLVAHVLHDANIPETTGDAELDSAIRGEVLGEVTGDPIYGDPLVGGILTKWKINRKLRRARNIRRKNFKRSQRDKQKDYLAMQLAAADEELARAQAGEGHDNTDILSGYQSTINQQQSLSPVPADQGGEGALTPEQQNMLDGPGGSTNPWDYQW